MRWLWLLCLISGCAAQNPAAAPSVPAEYGPTLMRKVEGGYELANRRLRLVINEKTGDVTYFGAAGGQRNLLGNPGITAQLERFSAVAPDGYVEKRDDQTWQYIGDTLSGVRWRKIYCLEYHSAYVTMLVENRTREPIDTAIAVRAHFAGGQTATQEADRVEHRIGEVSVKLQAFNEGKPLRPDWATLIGDRRVLAPNERIGITMQWRVDGL